MSTPDNPYVVGTTEDNKVILFVRGSWVPHISLPSFRKKKIKHVVLPDGDGGYGIDDLIAWYRVYLRRNGDDNLAKHVLRNLMQTNKAYQDGKINIVDE